MTSAITPQITRPPLPAAEHLLPRTDGGYSCHEVAVVTHGEFTGRVLRHIHHDSDGTRFEFDATIDGVVDASSSGVGDNPQRLRELASVAWATADELGEARARQRHPAGSGGLPVGFTTKGAPAEIGRGFCHEFATRTSRQPFSHTP